MHLANGFHGHPTMEEYKDSGIMNTKIWRTVYSAGNTSAHYPQSYYLHSFPYLLAPVIFFLILDSLSQFPQILLSLLH